MIYPEFFRTGYFSSFIFVNNYKSRAAHIIIHTEVIANAFDKLGFTGAKISK